MLEDYIILIALLNENSQLWKIIEFMIESLDKVHIRKALDSPGARF